LTEARRTMSPRNGEQELGFVGLDGRFHKLLRMVHRDPLHPGLAGWHVEAENTGVSIVVSAEHVPVAGVADDILRGPVARAAGHRDELVGAELKDQRIVAEIVPNGRMVAVDLKPANLEPVFGDWL